MDKFRNYDVVFSGLKDGKHRFTFEIDKAFFQLFDTEQDFTSPRITADVLMDKHSTFLEFWIKTTGTVELICDISNEPFDYHIDNEIKVLVKFGEEFDDSNEEVITIPHHDHAFNIAQLVYEDVMLSIPMKKISPSVDNEDLEILEKYSPKETEESKTNQQEQVNPMWEALRKLKDKE